MGLLFSSSNSDAATGPVRRRRRNSHLPYLRGRRIALSRPRRFIVDLMHFSKKVPSIPMQRRMCLDNLIAARQERPERISWCAIFLKAYSIVSASRPELRRAFMPFPWPHVYEHPGNIASFTLERMYQDEPAVFVGQIPRPEIIKLPELDAFIRHHKTAPLERIDSYRRALSVSRYPLPVRRLLWWGALSVDGLLRAKAFGTFGVSTVASLGAGSIHPLSPLTTTLNYGTFSADGSLDVRVTYDHRVLDGASVARALAALEETLHQDILPELLD
jgi:hypothetical protein